MHELIASALAPATLPMSIAMIAVVGYWCTVIAGFMDIEMLDVDNAFYLGLLKIGEVPISITLSLLTFFAWNLMMLGDHYLPAMGNWIWALYLPAAICSYALTRLILKPVGKFFARIRKSDAMITSPVAHLCILLGDTESSRISQGRISTDGAPITVSVKARHGKFYPRGSEVLIIEEDESGKFYYVEAMDELE